MASLPGLLQLLQNDLSTSKYFLGSITRSLCYAVLNIFHNLNNSCLYIRVLCSAIRDESLNVLNLFFQYNFKVLHFSTGKSVQKFKSVRKVFLIFSLLSSNFNQRNFFTKKTDPNNLNKTIKACHVQPIQPEGQFIFFTFPKGDTHEVLVK